MLDNWRLKKGRIGRVLSADRYLCFEADEYYSAILITSSSGCSLRGMSLTL